MVYVVLSLKRSTTAKSGSEKRWSSYKERNESKEAVKWRNAAMEAVLPCTLQLCLLNLEFGMGNKKMPYDCLKHFGVRSDVLGIYGRYDAAGIGDFGREPPISSEIPRTEASISFA
jgi:hypothetical protein